ncbi:tetratricopeptide repeat protein [Salinicola sp. 4072]|uniref:tetratricopeptide repeat protein n=1 Tax=Salinicola sp. 4072 TaxID=3082157 RepID=UPI002FCAF93F
MSKRKSSRPAPPRSKHQNAIEAYKQRARVLARDSQPDAAIQVYKQAAGLAPKDATLYFELGKLQVERRQIREGITHLEKALEIAPNFIPALIELGQTHSKHNNLEKALPLLEHALDQAPDNPPVHLVYGAAMQKQGKLPEAIDHFRYALELRLGYPTNNDNPPKKKQDFDKPATEELMWDTLTLLAKSGIHAFASYGTLLGLVREGGLLPFDKDIDFGIPHSEMEKACQCLESNGWIDLRMAHITNPRAFIHPVKEVTLDLSGFVVDPQTNETFTGFWMDNVPYEWSRNTKYVEINLQKDTSPTGQPIWSLKEPEVWLETIYGEWTISDPYFDTVIAAKNLCGFSLLTQCYAFSRIFSHWEKGNLKKALATAEHTLNHLPNDELVKRVKAHIEAALPGEMLSRSQSASSSTDEESGVTFEKPDESFGTALENAITKKITFN